MVVAALLFAGALAAPASALQGSLERAADRAGVPRALFIATCWVHDWCERDPVPFADVLRAQAERTFAEYPDLNAHRLGDWSEALLLSVPGDFRDAAEVSAQVYAALRDGLRTPQLELPPQEFQLWWTPGAGDVTAANFSPGREGARPDTVVIHDMEGAYGWAIAFFLEPTTLASAHFDVKAGEITQQVPLDDTAWHAGNRELNEASVGIEHEGYAAWPAGFTEELLRSSAALTRYLCDRLGIPKDRQHIIGHYEVPDRRHPGWYGGAAHHSDPCDDTWVGEPTWHNVPVCNWDWDRYLALVTGRR